MAVQATDIAVEEMGRGPDLVLVHGWAMNNRVWGPLSERLSDSFRLHLVELPGHGMSGFDSARVSLAEWAADLLAAVPAGAAWVGWSLGAQTAIQAALQDPGNISHLVLVAGTPRFVRGDDWPVGMTEEAFKQFADALRRDVRATLNRFLALEVRGAEGASQVLSGLKRSMADRPLPREQALEAGLQLLLESDLRQDMQKLRCPVAWLLGERDSLVDAALAVQFQQLTPGATVKLFEGAGHAPFLHRPDQCAEFIREFCRP